jgi:hypothetical protein
VPLVTLKLSRPRLQVPSLALWRAVLEDRRVNSPFQRFQRSLLLLLQLMLLCLAVLAAMLPFWSGAAGVNCRPTSGRRFLCVRDGGFTVHADAVDSLRPVCATS